MVKKSKNKREKFLESTRETALSGIEAIKNEDLSFFPSMDFVKKVKGSFRKSPDYIMPDHIYKKTHYFCCLFRTGIFEDRFKECKEKEIVVLEIHHQDMYIDQEGNLYSEDLRSNKSKKGPINLVSYNDRFFPADKVISDCAECLNKITGARLLVLEVEACLEELKLYEEMAKKLTN